MRVDKVLTYMSISLCGYDFAYGTGPLDFSGSSVTRDEGVGKESHRPIAQDVQITKPGPADQPFVSAIDSELVDARKAYTIAFEMIRKASEENPRFRNSFALQPRGGVLGEDLQEMSSTSGKSYQPGHRMSRARSASVLKREAAKVKTSADYAQQLELLRKRSYTR
jgi:hypothetical protein